MQKFNNLNQCLGWLELRIESCCYIEFWSNLPATLLIPPKSLGALSSYMLAKSPSIREFLFCGDCTFCYSEFFEIANEVGDTRTFFAFDIIFEVSWVVYELWAILCLPET